MNKKFEDFDNIIKDRKNLANMPDQKKHQLVSFVKSAIRIVGYIFIPINLIAATVILVVSELVGIVEEMV